MKHEKMGERVANRNAQDEIDDHEHDQRWPSVDIVGDSKLTFNLRNRVETSDQHPQTSNARHQCRGPGRAYEGEEEVVVLINNACVQPPAVMVEISIRTADALVAKRTVLAGRRHKLSAVGAAGFTLLAARRDSQLSVRHLRFEKLIRFSVDERDDDFETDGCRGQDKEDDTEDERAWIRKEGGAEKPEEDVEQDDGEPSHLLKRVEVAVFEAVRAGVDGDAIQADESRLFEG